LFKVETKRGDLSPEEVDQVGCAAQEVIAANLGVRDSRGLPICDSCAKFGETSCGGYCHLQQHGKPPRKGFCSGLRLRCGKVTITGGQVTFDLEALKALGVIQKVA